MPEPSPAPPPNIGFKEWSVVCDALARGRQSLIVRKGGIHEGRAGFEFRHSQFVLFPTRFHEQAKHVRPGELPENWGENLPEYAIGETVRIGCWAQREAVWIVTDWEKISALEPFHIWDESTVRDRFEWAQSAGDPPALKVALVRVSRLLNPWEFPYQRGHGGCRSWVELPAMPAAQPGGGSVAVLSAAAFAAEREAIEGILGKETAGG